MNDRLRSTTPPPLSRFKKASVEERRTEILETTRRVLIERGFANTRIADVAKGLDVSSSLIHYHFDSKEQLLAETFNHAATEDVAEMVAEIESAPTAAGKLDSLIRNYVPEGSDDVEWMLWIDAWGEALRNPLLRSISQRLDEESIGLIERVLRGGVDTGEFTCPDPAGSAMRLAGLIDGLGVQFAAHDGVLDREQLIHHVRVLAAFEVGLTVDDLVAAGAEGPAESAPVPTISAETEARLRRLVSLACDAVMRRDRDAWTSLWADDGRWDRGTRRAAKGRAALSASFDVAIGRVAWSVQTAPQAVFEVDEQAGTATGRVLVVERYQQPSGEHGTLIGVYHDRYVRSDRGWLFAERRLEVLERT